jgi:hypothetical protein
MARQRHFKALLNLTVFRRLGSLTVIRTTASALEAALPFRFEKLLRQVISIRRWCAVSRLVLYFPFG